MNKKNDIAVSYEILLKIYRDGTYLNLIMKDVSNKRVAKTVYGVLDHHYKLNYIVNSLTEKVKNNVRPLLLIVAYHIVELKTPYNVVVNECNETLESIGKSALKSFVNAVAKKMQNCEYSLPNKNDKNYVEVKYNMPSFLVGMYKKDYPNDYEKIIFTQDYPKVHIRLNKNTKEEEILLADKNAEKTLTGFFVTNNKEIAMLNFLGKITYMGYTSTLIAESIKVKEGTTILDVCSAPGGKAVALAQKGAKVTACDIYDHRVELIRSYAERMKVGVDAYKQDGRNFVKKWKENFDVVLVDAPCSGMGVKGKKKDVVFNKTYQDILDIARLQQDILQNASQYVKSGGLLVYSTCTIFNKENKDNVVEFLEKNINFKLEKIDLPYKNDGDIQFLPDGKGMEGFYLCHMRKN